MTLALYFIWLLLLYFFARRRLLLGVPCEKNLVSAVVFAFSLSVFAVRPYVQILGFIASYFVFGICFALKDGVFKKS